MPFCPKCEYEYKIGVAICPDCNEKLVERLPEKPDTDTQDERFKDWMPIARITSHQLAAMVLEALRAKGIAAVIDSGAGYFGETGQMGISSFRAVGGAYTLMVPEVYAKDACGEAAIILGDDWEKVRLIFLDT
jgi:hypothetical protein